MMQISTESNRGSSWRAALIWSAGWWFAYTLLLIIWAASASADLPRTILERAIPVWPPSAPLDAWLERVVLWSQARYDVFWYIGIAQYGYGYEQGSTAFHPLYPVLINLASRIFGGHYLLAAWLITQCCCVTMLTLLYRLVLLDYDVPTARRTVWFLLGSPLGFAFLIPYTESLLMVGIIGAFYAARHGRWWLAGIAGAAAALTKQPGVMVILPLLWEIWQQHGEQLRRRNLRVLVRPLAGLALIPAALGGWILYRATLGDVAFDWRDPASLLNRLLVTPDHEAVWGQYFSWPWVDFLLAVEQLQTRPYLYLQLNLFITLVLAAIGCAAVLKQRRSYAIWAGMLIIANLSIVHTLWPYMSAIRRFVIVFPIFIQLAVWGRFRIVRILVPLINLILWAVIVLAYVRSSFVP